MDDTEASGNPLKTPFEPVDWKARLNQRMAEHARKTAAKKNEREARTKARNYGLTQRHATKLARNRGDKPTDQP